MTAYPMALDLFERVTLTRLEIVALKAQARELRAMARKLARECGAENFTAELIPGAAIAARGASKPVFGAEDAKTGADKAEDAKTGAAKRRIRAANGADGAKDGAERAAEGSKASTAVTRDAEIMARELAADAETADAEAERLLSNFRRGLTGVKLLLTKLDDRPAARALSLIHIHGFTAERAAEQLDLTRRQFASTYRRALKEAEMVIRGEKSGLRRV